jgi:3-methyladenine DNA glycosylase AlkC
MTLHTADYAYNRADGRWRVRCTACPHWERFGTEEYVVNQFACHDIEQWAAATPAQGKPAEVGR